MSTSTTTYELDDLETMLGETSPIVLRKLRPAQHTKKNPFERIADSMDFKPPIDVEKRLAGMTYMGGGDSAIHGTQISVTASLLNKGVAIDEVVGLVLEATRVAAGEYNLRWDLKWEENKIRGMCTTWLEKHPVNQNRKTPSSTTATKPVATNNDDRGIGDNRGTPFYKTVSKIFFDLRRDIPFRIVQDSRGVEQCWRYDGDLWLMIPDVTAWLNRELEDIVCSIKRENMSSNKMIAEARGLVLRDASVVSNEPIVFDDHGMVPVKGFLIDPRTLQLIPMRKEHYCTWHLGDIYDPNAGCPNWLTMLNDAFSDLPDPERIQVIALLQDFLGAALIDKKPKALNRALVLQGGPNCGKTAILTVMSGLICEHPISTPFSDLGGPHGLQEFTRRAAWVLHEAFTQGVWHNSERVKAILSGDPQSINPKGSKAITTLIRVVAMWATNHSIKFKEATGAMLVRMILIKMNVKFVEGQELGTTLEARKHGFKEPQDFVLATETAGLLNWALIGLQRVLPRGYFLDTEAGKAALAEVGLDSNDIAGFIEECVEFSGTKMLSSPDLHLAVSSWWRETKGEDRKIPSPDSIGRSITALAEQRIAQDNKKFRNEKGVRFYAGMLLNEVGAAHWDSEHAMLSISNKLPPRVSATATERDKSIPDSWGEHPLIKRIKSLAKKGQNEPKF
jgi:phage/plasmid-associated DNA primase